MSPKPPDLGDPKLEAAVEVVIRWLDAHGYGQLALDVAGATDPAPKTRARWARAAAKRLRSAAAAALGRSTSEAKRAAARANGRKGGRRTTLITVGTGTEVEVHAEAEWIGYTVAGQPAFRARTPAAGRWLKRHGYEHAAWFLREVFETIPNGRCWALA